MPGGRLSTRRVRGSVDTESEEASEGPQGFSGGEDGSTQLPVAGWETLAEKNLRDFLARFLRSGKLGVRPMTLMSKSRGLRRPWCHRGLNETSLAFERYEDPQTQE